MPSARKTLDAVMGARADANLRFDALRRRVSSMGFAEHIRGDHHIVSRKGVEEIINLQPRRGGKAKPYQVRQVRNVIAKYRLSIEP